MAQEVESLESEVNLFASELPYWGQYLCEKILSCCPIGDAEIDIAYAYLLEDLDLAAKTKREPIKFVAAAAGASSFKDDIQFSKLANLEGVNALSEKQTIHFSPNLTILFGVNGSGKSGYIRLLKNAFYSKAPEQIQPNVYSEETSKPISAEFSFRVGGTEHSLNYPDKEDLPEFQQFSVFDGKSVLKHLENKNEFEFRPAGLSFFSAFTDAIKTLEKNLDSGKAAKQCVNNFSDFFDGDSEIRVLISHLSGKTQIPALQKYLPLTVSEVKENTEKQRRYDELASIYRNRDKQIESLQALRLAVIERKDKVETLNRFFAEEHINNTYEAILDCLRKEEQARKDGIDNFANASIKNIGGSEWKNFIMAADAFAKHQDEAYPTDDDSCLLCQQPLSAEAKQLIANYWVFVKSAAEKELKEAQVLLDKGILAFEKLIFDLFPENNTLTEWMKEGYLEILQKLKQQLSQQLGLATTIINDLRTKQAKQRIMPSAIPLDGLISMEIKLDERIGLLLENKVDPEFEQLRKELTFFAHREKLALHIDRIKKYIEDQEWILKAGKVKWGKRGVTDMEKYLSEKYFNQKYIDTFNAQCAKMKGNFGVFINHTGAGGTSYRQLFIKGKSPAVILSDGEQKVIAISDFIAEMSLSDINKGVIFDDPVTSLDHDRRELIAEHLVDISANKQVIVFTHDICFLLSLIDHADAKAVSYNKYSLYKSNDSAGITDPNLPWVASNVKDRCGYLKNQLVAIMKLHKNGSPDLYSLAAKGWLGLLRESWERSVEERLFKGVVQRFKYGIETNRLSGITVTSDLIDAINDGMTNTSKWVHDQAAAMNTPAPTPDELQVMIDNFEDFIKNKCKAP